MYKQVIIVRKDLSMSAGKMAAQVSHASMAFLMHMIREHSTSVKDCMKHPTMMRGMDGTIKPQLYKHPEVMQICREAFDEGKKGFAYKHAIDENGHSHFIRTTPQIISYEATIPLDKDLYEQWICGAFTKVILEAKNRNQLLKAEECAKEIGMREDVDYFLIKDNCYTELEPEEFDDQGQGHTLTCIGFRPMDSEMIDKVSKKFQIYHG